jgi:WD40 repeat protein
VIAFHPDGRRLAVARGRSVRIWDFVTSGWVAEMPEREQSVLRLAYSRDGERLAAAMSNNLFQIWTPTGDIALSLPWASAAWSVSWTPQNDLILVPLDRTVRILKARSR